MNREEMVKELTVAIARADDFGAKILTTAIALVRAETLEDAAQKIVALGYAPSIAAAIRALKDKP